MKSDSSSYRVGFLGVGSVAVDHAKVLAATGNIISRGCGMSESSPRWQRFQTVAPEARFESSVQSMLEDPDVDAVVSCLPWNVTETWLTELLSTPKPVLIEKPIALSSEALSSAISHADSALHNKYVGFNRRFYRTVQKLRDRVKKGGLKSAEITISETVDRLAELYGPEILDHMLVYASCHILDTAIHVMGPLKPLKVYSHEGSANSKPVNSLSGLLETAQGTPVFLNILADSPTPVGLRIFFDDQTTWHLSPLEHLVAYRDYDLIEPTDEIKIRRYTPKPFLEVTEDAEFKPGFFGQMRAFLNGREQHLSATPVESLELLRFIETLQCLAAGSKPKDSKNG